MIVFRKQEMLINARQKLDSLRKMAHAMRSGRPPHTSVVDFLIEFSEFESAVVDAHSPERDGIHPADRALRQIALSAGDLFYGSWMGGAESLSPAVERMEACLAKALRLDLPESICLRVSEGFVHYGIFPETYIQAAERFCREVQPGRTVCIGIRSIGAGLSAVVAAVLKRHGFDVHSCTVRPRGHPFARSIVLSPELEKTLAGCRAAHYLVVDEGPGLSGSSLCSTAQRLSGLGIGDERIAFFPCWEPDGEAFVSGEARRRWIRHKKYSGSFEDAWIHNGRLSSSLPYPDLTDISAGRWREMFYAAQVEMPAVHPHHEQRKYLCTGNGSRLLVKFAGLGKYGKAKYARMERLFASGFVPEPIGLVKGFLVSKFQEGRPFALGSFIRKDLVQTLAGYLAYIREAFPAENRIAPEEELHMIRINVLEGLGEEWARRIEGMETLDRVFRDSCPTEIDGRMLPHEWLSTEKGYLKTDSVDHHVDQFFPRSQDSAWDVAATCIEFGFDRRQRDYFIDRYQALTKDQLIRWRLPSYAIAYSAFRLGYAALSADSLAGTGEALKFRAMAERYRTILKRLILIHT